MSTARPPRRSLPLLILVVSLIALALSAAPAQAAPGDPFDPATARVFVSQAGTLYAAYTDPSGNGRFEEVGPGGFTYNAIAYNPTDNYIYGISNFAGRASDGTVVPANALVRIGRGGYTTRVGTATFPPSDVGAFQVIGAFGADGYLYVSDQVGTGVTEIDVATGTVADTVTLSKSITAAGGGADWTLKAGYFWALGSNTLVRVDPTTGEVTSFADADIPDCRSYGAAWTFGNGNLGFSCNNTGQVVQVAVGDPTSATPTPRVIAGPQGPVSTNNDGTATTGLPADLGVVKHGPAQFTRGDTISYTLTVTNNGRGTSSGFVVSDSLPGSLSNVSSPDPACTTSGHDVTCVSGTLAVGASRSFTITAKTPTSGGCLTNEATVLGNEADPTAANDTSSTTSCPIRADLSLDKRAASGPQATVGDNIQYRLRVTNHGPDRTQAPITITDRVPADLTLRSAHGKGWTCDVDRAKNTVTCTLTGQLGASAVAAPVTVVARATKAAIGRTTNTACVHLPSDIGMPNNCDGARVHVVPSPPPSSPAPPSTHYPTQADTGAY